MRAAVLRAGRIVVDDVPEPVPGPGQVLLETVACGICGSDLHAVRHGADLVASSRACGMALFDFDPDADLVMGHEIVARVLDVGRGVDGLRPGTVVAPHPVVRLPGGVVRSVGFANQWPGGYAERFVVDAEGCVPVPAGVAPELFALTEPLAVGLHAVRRSRAVALGSAVVLGCGPVGLAVIANLLAGAGSPRRSAPRSSSTRARPSRSLPGAPPAAGAQRWWSTPSASPASSTSR
jgi:threonine dehydrogenase-like Zn-dependent dehydrogenase